jgi:hypothetical protein
MSSSPYDASFHKIVALSALADGEPQTFRAAGSTVVIRRDGNSVTAIDGSVFVEGADWHQLHARAGLAVRTEGGDVWVCLEDCEP